MNRVQQLKQQQARAIADAQKVASDAAAAGRTLLTEDEEQLAARFMADYDALERQVKLEEQIAERQRQQVALVAGDVAPNPGETRAAVNTPEYRAAFWRAMRSGFAGLNSDDQALLTSCRAEVTPEMRAMAGANPSAGGFALPPGTQGELEIALKQFGSVEQAGADVITTADGNEINWPTVNDTGNYGERIGENTAVGTQDPVLGNVKLGAYYYSSKKVLVPLGLIADSGFPMEPFVMGLCGERIGRKQNLDFTTGDGASGPTGVVTAATVGVTGATGNATTIKSGDDIIALIGSIDPAYLNEASCGFMFNNASLTKILSLKDGQGNYLMTPGLVQGAPASIRGYKYTLNAEMPVMAANARSILFGAFKKYKIRRVGTAMIFRLDQVNMLSFQMTYVGFHRADGCLLDAGTNPIKCWKNSAS